MEPPVVLTLRQREQERMAGSPKNSKKKSTVGVVLDDSVVGLVNMVIPGGPAHKKIRKGDIISDINGVIVTKENLIPLLAGDDEVNSVVRIGIKGSFAQVVVHRGDIHEVERIAAMFVSLATLQDALKAHEQLLRLANAVEPCMEQVVEWLHMASESKERHITDLETALAAEIRRAESLEVECSKFEGAAKMMQAHLTEDRARAESNLRAAEESAKRAAEKARETLQNTEQSAFRAAKAAAEELQAVKESMFLEQKSAQEKLDTAQKKVIDKQSEIETLRSTLAEMKENHSAERANREDAIASLKEELLQVRQKAGSRDLQLETLNADLSTAQEKVAQMTNEVEQLRSALAQCNSERVKEQIAFQENLGDLAQTKSKLEELKATCEVQQSELQAFQKEKAYLSREVENRTDLVETTTQKVQNADAEIQRLETARRLQKETLAELKMQLKSATTDLDAERLRGREQAEECAALNAQMQQMQQELRDLEGQMRQFEGEAKELRLSKSTLEEHTQALGRRGDQLESSRQELVCQLEQSQAKCESLSQQLEEVHEERDKLKLEREEIQKNLSRCRIDMKRLQTATEKQQSVMGQLRERDIELQASLDQRCAEVKELTMNLEAERHESRSVEQRRILLEKQLSSTKERLVSETQSYRSASRKLKEMEAERDSLAQELGSAQKLLTGKSSALGVAEQENFQFEAKLIELEKRLEWEKRKTAKHQQQKRDYLNEIDQLNHRIADISRQSCLYADQATSLEKELERQRAIGEHMATSWKRSLRSPERDFSLQDTLQRNGLLLGHLESTREARERLKQDLMEGVM